MRQTSFLRENALSIGFRLLYLVSLAAEALVGHAHFNADQAAHSESAVSLGHYVTSSAFAADVTENWQSEYLQFLLFVVVTVWLIQRGSPESKPPGKEGVDSDEEQLVGPYARPDSPLWARVGGWRTAVYSNSLAVVMGGLWVLSWCAQSVTGRVVYNVEQVEHHEATVSLVQYVGTSEFWDRTLQNWQSEFLAVGSMAALSIYLRQRGSPESKPVGAPHGATDHEL
jgi:membrane protein implicated in regulation of membrane protease activity